MNTDTFRHRRTRLLAQMQHGIAIVPTAPECFRNRDTQYPYRHDSSFYYLTGFKEPEALLVLIAGESPQSILFCRDKDPQREIWDGHRFGHEAAREVFGFDAAYSIAELKQRLPELFANQTTLYYALGQDTHWDARIIETLNTVRTQGRTGTQVPSVIQDSRALIDEMRLFKDEHEIAIMRRAAQISTDAHCRAMRASAPGKFEYEIEAELLHAFRSAGAQAPAYSSIVAGGANACILHYVENTQQLKAGDLLLIDAGCELDSYASDITRTFPVSGKFSGPQRDIYELVLAAQTAAIAEIRPGNLWDAPHEAAVTVLTQGMLDLKLLKGCLADNLESGAYKRFYMHRTGHWLGLDVHDVGEYKLNNHWRPLQANMMLTVEPGCYIQAAADIPEVFWNIGVRIEDDVLVTNQGCEVITLTAPKTIKDIETLMA